MRPRPGTYEDDSSNETDNSSSYTPATLGDDGDIAVLHQDSVTAPADEGDASPAGLFPFHLIAGCSAAERAMSQYSQTLTSQDVRRMMGLQGTS
jgi:hypothetical protein